MPAKFHEFVYREATPFVIDEACDIAEPDAGFRVVLGDVPATRSSDIEELGNKAGIILAVLRVVAVTFGKVCERFEKLCLGHSVKG